jgi:hypothetical protein
LHLDAWVPARHRVVVARDVIVSQAADAQGRPSAGWLAAVALILEPSAPTPRW